jgi:hypothetical protein
MQRNGVSADHQISNASRVEDGQEFFEFGQHPVKVPSCAKLRGSSLQPRAGAHTPGGPPFAELRVLHFIEAGVGHDGFVHRLVCSIGDGGLQPASTTADPPRAQARDDKSKLDRLRHPSTLTWKPRFRHAIGIPRQCRCQGQCCTGVEQCVGDIIDRFSDLRR